MSVFGGICSVSLQKSKFNIHEPLISIMYILLMPTKALHEKII